MTKNATMVNGSNAPLEDNKKSKAGALEKFSWCLYDFANSSYTTIIVTVAYSVYFTTIVAADPSNGADGTRLWSWGYSLSMLIVALISPVLGAVADYANLKKFFLMLFSYICIVATALLFFVRGGDIALGLGLFAISNIAFNAGMTFYNSFLIDITDRENMGKISGYGWALGYIGGLLALVMVFPLLKEAAAEPVNYRITFVITALFFLVASIPTFLFLKERDGEKKAAKSGYLKEGFKRISLTFHEIKRFKELVRFFVSYFIYTDAVNTVIVFSAIFATIVLGFTTGELIIYFIITQLSAALGALVFGNITDRIGAKGVIAITLLIWIGVVVAAYFVETKTGFYIIGLTAGTALGSNQSSSRTLLAQMTPHGKNAEFFGFFSLVGKFSAVTGPIIYGEVVTLTGSHRVAVLSLSIFFIIGLLLLFRVNGRRGIEAAKEYEDKEKNSILSKRGRDRPSSRQERPPPEEQKPPRAFQT